MSTSLDISFLLRTLLIFSNPTSFGVTLQTIILPTVVSSIEVLPSASFTLTLIAEWIEIVSVS